MKTAAAIALLDRALTAGWIDSQFLTLDPRLVASELGAVGKFSIVSTIKFG